MKKYKMKLILLRHAKTKENEKRIAQGQLPGNISKKGLRQAKRVAKKIEKLDIDKIYSSDLRRAKETASEIKNKKINYTKELRERNFGIFQGKKYPKSWNKFVWQKGFLKENKGEGNEEFLNRMKKFLEKIQKKEKEKTILIITHKRVIQAIISIIKNIPTKEIPKIKIPRNAKFINLEMK